MQAVRSGRWKLHFPHTDRSLAGEPGSGGLPGPYEERKIGLSLFDLAANIGETTNVADRYPDVVKRLKALADRYPDVVKRLKALADRARDDLGDTATKRKGKNVRPPGQI